MKWTLRNNNLEYLDISEITKEYINENIPKWGIHRDRAYDNFLDVEQPKLNQILKTLNTINLRLDKEERAIAARPPGGPTGGKKNTKKNNQIKRKVKKQKKSKSKKH